MAKTEKRKTEQTTEGTVATIEVPLGEPREGVYLSPHLDMRLSDPQARRLHEIREGLIGSSARLCNGRPVVSTADAVRWMLEQAE
jgi:hypothetical protein